MLKVNYNVLNFIITSFKEKISFSLTDQQKKIVAVVALIFACLFLYLVSRFYKRKQTVSVQESKEALFQQLLKAGKKADEALKKSESVPEDNWKDNFTFKIADEALKKSESVSEDNWKDNFTLVDGQVKYYHSNGTVWEGTMENGRLVDGRVKWFPAHKTLWEVRIKNGELQGTFADGKMNGLGKITLPDGTIFEGLFKNSLLNGPGKVIKPDGTIFEGPFENGEMNGSGKMTKPNGIVIESEYFSVLN